MQARRERKNAPFFDGDSKRSKDDVVALNIVDVAGDGVGLQIV